ncbi:hypothetical protein WA026_004242 [Henosepilachna vigintioctopunctata]|uniref:Uncharacterized protein n=1 Tax=Henosepilachna vigintioctopunctata TaxID=420089 RepID=A0AAW1V6D7_9CUCU
MTIEEEERKHTSAILKAVVAPMQIGVDIDKFKSELVNESMKRKQEFNTDSEPQIETSRRGEIRNSQEDSENQEYALNSRTKHDMEERINFKLENINENSNGKITQLRKELNYSNQSSAESYSEITQIDAHKQINNNKDTNLPRNIKQEQKNLMNEIIHLGTVDTTRTLKYEIPLIHKPNN